ncbi:fasciclin domain-containing protein [Streptomyces zagrosensis]|uniref:Putative surface protein with fasciclin (FAS1) repeats n=1 Tax=Streptomyces zagrosensis TaxID=1042984 RepID=A0A7W9Q7Q8_9ACTN|nr:fasciclin domain-containing protein [Streptomyces zagrosensis]MBB5935150.1 putative surface protein with fasciclin (FAS1) repeats [Streptomyces zagrosensis]
MRTTARAPHTPRTRRTRRLALALVAAAALPLSLTACSDGGDDKSKDQDSGADSSASAEEKPGPSDEQPSSADNAMAKPFGMACSTVPKEGSGSFDGMAKDPVATAASNNPALSTLVAAVKKAGLVDTLNSAENITVFAPTNEAFDKIPKADLEKVMNDKAMLTKVLTYHVVGQPLSPEKLANGSYPTLEKSKLTTAGSGASFKVNDSAQVVCGDVKTSNATVHIIDSVLMPPM